MNETGCGMLPHEYIIFSFFWSCWLSVDYVQRKDALDSILKKHKRIISGFLMGVNLVFLQIGLPVAGYILLYVRPDNMDRILLPVLVVLIMMAISIVCFGYLLVKKKSVVNAEWYMLIMLCIGSVGVGGGLTVLDRKYTLFSPLVSVVLVVLQLSYGWVCLKRCLNGFSDAILKKENDKRVR